MVVFNSFQGFVHIAELWVVKTHERVEEVAIWHAAYGLLRHIVCHLLLDRYVVCGERYSTRAGFLGSVRFAVFQRTWLEMGGHHIQMNERLYNSLIVYR